MTPRSVRITGWGMYAPERRLTNADLERVVDTSDEWIVTRTGIRERRIAARPETTATLAAIAGKRAIAVAGLQPDDIDVILVATLTPDYWMPSTGALVKEAIGNTRAAAMDVPIPTKSRTVSPSRTPPDTRSFKGKLCTPISRLAPAIR